MFRDLETAIEALTDAYDSLSIEMGCASDTIQAQPDLQEVFRLARLGAAVEAMPPKSLLSHCHNKENFADNWIYCVEQERKKIDEFTIPCQCSCCTARKSSVYQVMRKGTTAAETLNRGAHVHQHNR
jgi:hypothetical protein